MTNLFHVQKVQFTCIRRFSYSTRSKVKVKLSIRQLKTKISVRRSKSKLSVR